MKLVILTLFSSLVGLNLGYVYESPMLYDDFPEDFVWGVATAAYQVTQERPLHLNVHLLKRNRREYFMECRTVLNC